MSTANLIRWDDWFVTCGDEESLRAWKAAKQVHTDPALLERWAAIIELNRIDRVTRVDTEVKAG